MADVNLDLLNEIRSMKAELDYKQEFFEILGEHFFNRQKPDLNQIECLYDFAVQQLGDSRDHLDFLMSQAMECGRDN